MQVDLTRKELEWALVWAQTGPLSADVDREALVVKLREALDQVAGEGEIFLIGMGDAAALKKMGEDFRENGAKELLKGLNL